MTKDSSYLTVLLLIYYLIAIRYQQAYPHSKYRCNLFHKYKEQLNSPRIVHHDSMGYGSKQGFLKRIVKRTKMSAVSYIWTFSRILDFSEEI